MTALTEACAGGQLDVVKVLLADCHVNPAAGDNQAVTASSQREDTQVFNLLMADERVTPTIGTMKKAITSKNMAVLELLLTDRRVDPFANENWAIKFIIHEEVSHLFIKAFLMDDRVKPETAVTTNLLHDLDSYGQGEQISKQYYRIRAGTAPSGY